MLDDATLERARQTGALMRLGVTIAAGMPGYLRHCPLSLKDGVLRLKPTPEGQTFMGEEVAKRLDRAAKLMGLESAIT